MPIYEYRCCSCDNHFEVMTSFGASVSCPQCQSGEVNKVFSSFASPSGGGGGEFSSSGGSKCSGCSAASCPPGCK